VSQIDIGRVGQIWRYPVSSIGGERVNEAELTSAGVEEDRRWCLFDPATGEVAAPEKRKRWRSAPDLVARHPEQLELRFMDGTWLPAFSDEAKRALERHFGFAVEVRPAHSGEGPIEPNSVRPRYRRTPIHLLTTGSMRALARLLPDSAIDPRRFRPNLVVETEADGFVEQEWIGRDIAVGSARLRVIEPCTRCAFVMIGQQELGQDRAILPEIVAAADGALGVLCSVLAPGATRTGDGLLPEGR
jgi:uncharacterized protein YcbX